MNKALTSLTTDPYMNLGREELLLERLKEGEVMLYIWQNAHTIVIGKNQNPWRECAVSALERDEGRLARRSSGGGAVYHDMGNLNFTFLADRNLYDVKRQLSVILAAVRSFGIAAEFTGRNDLTVDGKKFSGNAFRMLKDRALHHGTLLINADMSAVARYLTVSPEKMQSKGVASVAARVCNLRDYNPLVSVEEMKSALLSAFAAEYGEYETISEFSPGELEPYRAKYAAWEWRFGESPKFDVLLEHRFDWGYVEMNLKLSAGRIDSAQVFSDAMDEAFIGAIGARLVNIPFHSEELARAVSELDVERETSPHRAALAEWLLSKGF